MRRARIAAVAAALALAVTAQRLGLFALFAEPSLVKQRILDLGPAGYAAFFASFALLNPIGVPSTVFVLAAALLWPWPVAFALSMAGGLAASVVGFSFARFVARDWVASILPARFKGYDEALERRAAWTVFLLRTLFWASPLLHGLLGVSKVRFSTHLWVSAIAYAPPFFLMSWLGQKALDWLKGAPREVWVGAGVVIVLAVAITIIVRLRARRTIAS